MENLCKKDRNLIETYIVKSLLIGLFMVFTSQLNAADRTVLVGESIQGAIDYVAANGGGTVTLATGTHNISTPVRIKSNVTLQGEGDWASLLKTTTNMKMIVQNNEGMVNVTIQNLAIQGTNALNGGGIEIVSMKTDNNNVNIINVHCYETGWGVHIKGAKNVTVKDCLFGRNGTACKEGYAHNMYLRRCTVAVVRDSKFLNSTSANGINISYSSKIEIYNCEMSGNYFRGVRAAVTDGFLVHDCIITNNGDVGLNANAEVDIVTTNIDFQNNCVSGNKVGINANSGATGICKNNNSFGNGKDYTIASSVNQSGNISDSSKPCVKINTTGIIQEEKKNDIKFYPNPVSNFLQVENGEGTTLELYNKIGLLLFKNNILKNTQSVDFSGFNSGIYFARITINGLVICKIIKISK